VRLSRVKKAIAKSKEWGKVVESLKAEISDEDKLFLEAAADTLDYPLSDLALMWSLAAPDDREDVRHSLQAMMNDKIKGELPWIQGITGNIVIRDKEYYRKIGIQKAAEAEAERLKKIENEPCEGCNGTGKIEGMVCLKCGGSGIINSTKKTETTVRDQ